MSGWIVADFGTNTDSRDSNNVKTSQSRVHRETVKRKSGEECTKGVTRIINTGVKLSDKLKSAHAIDTLTSNNQPSVGLRLRTKQKADPSRNAGTKSLWVEKYAPKTLSEVAGNKKKMLSLKDWLEEQLQGLSKETPILFLSGPSGCGKSSAVLACCSDMGLSVLQWKNPETDPRKWEAQVAQSDWRHVDWNSPRDLQYESQTKQFERFLFSGSRYHSVITTSTDPGGADSRVLLIDEFPNVYLHHDPSALQDLIRSYVTQGRSPLVIAYDSTLSAGHKSVFPADFVHSLSAGNIAFNPVPKTDMTKFLQRVAMEEGVSLSKESIEELCVTSGGDLRVALNQLQFLSSSQRGENFPCRPIAKPSSRKGKGRKGEKSATGTLSGVIGKDHQTPLFSALGKVLHCKRQKESTPTASAEIESSLPAHMESYKRDPLSFDPEEVFESAQVGGDFYRLFLHENYPDFFARNTGDLAMAADYLSDSDCLASMARTTGGFGKSDATVLPPYAISLATRGLVFSNSRKGNAEEKSSDGWKPLRKSKWYKGESDREESRVTDSLMGGPRPMLVGGGDDTTILMGSFGFGRLLRKGSSIGSLSSGRSDSKSGRSAVKPAASTDKSDDASLQEFSDRALDLIEEMSD